MTVDFSPLMLNEALNFRQVLQFDDTFDIALDLCRYGDSSKVIHSILFIRFRFHIEQFQKEHGMLVTPSTLPVLALRMVATFLLVSTQLKPSISEK